MKGNFWTTSYIVMGFLTGSIVLLAILVGNVGLHVRAVELRGSASQAQLADQQVRVRFNRPLDKAVDYGQFVSVIPQAGYKVINLGAELVIDFTHNLRSDTAFQVALAAGLSDVYQDTLGSDVKIDFHTRDLQLYYLEPGQSEDKIWQSEVDGSMRNQLFTAPSILRFAVKDNQLAVVTKEADDINRLQLVNLDSQKSITLTSNSQSVYELQFSPVTPELFFVMENISYQDGYVISDGGRRVWVYNIDSGVQYELDVPEQIKDLDEFVVAQDGRTILLKDTLEARYYLVDIANPDRLVQMGRFVQTGGFNSASDSTIYVQVDTTNEDSTPVVVTVDKDKQMKAVSSARDFAVDARFLATNPGFVYARQYSQLSGSKGLFEIVVATAKGGVQNRFQQSNLSLELPKLSPDDRYLVAEVYTPESLRDYDNLRVLGFQAKPRFATLTVYDLETGQIVAKDVPGIEAVIQ